MTKKEIQSKLKERGVKFDPRKSKSELEGILNKALEANEFEPTIIDQSNAEKTKIVRHERVTLQSKIQRLGELLKELQKDAYTERLNATTKEQAQAAVQCEKFCKAAAISFQSHFEDSQKAAGMPAIAKW